MNLTFLGTSAYDFSSKLENEFKDKFDFDARRSSHALLDGKYLIDFGMHGLDTLRILKADTSKITDIFFTHTHTDHFDVNNIKKLAAGRKQPLNIWVREDASVPLMINVRVKRMKLYETYELPDGLKVTGLESNHEQSYAPQWLLFEKGDKSLLYALDGAWFMMGAYYYLANKKLNCMVVDATCGDYEGEYRMSEHNSIPMIRYMLPCLKAFGIIDDKSRVYFSHMAPSLHKPHVELCKTAEKMGCLVAYDGLNVKI